MALTFDSPRFSLRTDSLQSIEAAIDSVGHAVIEDVWNVNYLTSMMRTTERAFASDDAKYIGNLDRHDQHSVSQFISGVIEPFSVMGNDDADGEFFVEMERSGITAPLRYLLAKGFALDIPCARA